MIEELIDYIEANYGTVDNIIIDEENQLTVIMKHVVFNTSMIERIMDNNIFLEGVFHNYDSIAIFEIVDADDIGQELLALQSRFK